MSVSLWTAHASRFFIASAVVFACTPSADGTWVPPTDEDEVSVPAKKTTEKKADTTTDTTSTPTTSDASTSDASTDATTISDAGTLEAGPADAAPKPDGGTGKFGDPCTGPTSCASGLCVEFEDVGLRCTIACNDDDECPGNADCDRQDDGPKVCEVEEPDDD